MKYLILLAMLVIATACGRESATATTPPLFAAWTQTGGNSTMDLRSGSIGAFPLTLVFQNGFQCAGTVTVTGDGSTGNAVVSGLIPNDGSCDVYLGTYAYTASAGNLSLCKGGTCSTYH